MAQYATTEQLAGYLQQDVDTYTATLVLQMASGAFSQAANTWWEPTAATYTRLGTTCTAIKLPYRPVTSVSQVRINGVVVTGWTLRKNILYREAGFGTSLSTIPDEVEIDLIHGYQTPTDDVVGAVLEVGGAGYSVPVSAVAGESIDDYQVRYTAAGGGIQLTESAARLAEQYRGTFAA